jgi:peptidoglycan/xylan/chitin deacetylase (PgdA/CDA1 family)
MRPKKIVLVLLVFVLSFSVWSCRKDVIPAYRIALTFDDGPDSVYTPQVLDILKRENVKATFFLIGKKIAKNTDVTLRIRDEGHCIGNHSYTHCWFPKLNFTNVMKEITKTEDLIQNLCGSSHRYFRAPWGAIEQSQELELKAQGFTVVKWNVDPNDWDIKHTTVEKIVNVVVNNAGPEKIVLLHCADYAGIEGREKTIAALPHIIQILKQQHYLFVTIEEILSRKP